MNNVSIFDNNGYVRPISDYIEDRWALLKQILNEHQWQILDLDAPIVQQKTEELFTLSAAREVLERFEGVQAPRQSPATF